MAEASEKPTSPLPLEVGAACGGFSVQKIEMKKMSQQEGVTFLLRRIASGEGENGKEDLLKSVSDNRAVSNCEGGSWTFAY